MSIEPVYILIILFLILVFSYFLNKKLEITKNKKETIIVYIISFFLTIFTGFLLISSYYMLNNGIY